MARKIAGSLSNAKAFTLIEVIVSLILMGILVAIVGFGLVQISKGYLFARQNSETVQKAQIAMVRIVKELGAATAITSAGVQTVSYTRRQSAGSSTFIPNTITISGGLITMSGTTTGTLLNNVAMDTAFSKFGYFDASGNTTANLANIRRIDVVFRITGADNISSDFANSVWINESYQ
jgi:prepilin-type N-terminal cleavage/methylation domain-containing protein